MTTKPAPQPATRSKDVTAQDAITAARTFLERNVSAGKLRVESVSNVPEEGWQVTFEAFVENPTLTVAHGDVKRAIYDQMVYVVSTDQQGKVVGMSMA